MLKPGQIYGVPDGLYRNFLHNCHFEKEPVPLICEITCKMSEDQVEGEKMGVHAISVSELKLLA